MHASGFLKSPEEEEAFTKKLLPTGCQINLWLYSSLLYLSYSSLFLISLSVYTQRLLWTCLMSLASLKLPSPFCPLQNFVGINKNMPKHISTVFFHIAYEIFLMFLAFLFHFLSLCSPGRHTAVYILKASAFVNCYLLFQTTFLLTAQRLRRH